jgi:hypothetical protein
MSMMSELGDLQTSKLRPYSIGIVAENKKIGSKQIQVSPLENVAFINGEVAGTLTVADASGVDASGASYSASTNTSAAITATWLAMNDANRLTAPDVRRGDPVQIWQFADEDKYWWTCLTADNSRKRLETIIYGVSNSTKEDEPLTNKNMYWWEVSTHRKVIHLGTSKSQGEPFRYDIQIDCGNGKIVIMDDAGNYVSMDSAQKRIELMNSAGSHYDMFAENLTVTIPETTTFKSNNLVIDARQTIEYKAGVSYSVHSPRITQKADNSATYEGPSTLVAGDTINVQASSDATVSGGSTAILTSGGSAIVESPGTVII